MNESDFTSMPDGITLIDQSPQGFEILHERTGMQSLIGFTIWFLIGWTLVCGFALFLYFGGARNDSGTPMPFYLTLPFLAGELFVVVLLLMLKYQKRTFVADQASLQVTIDVLGFKRSWQFSRDSIQKLVQIRDGGTVDDSFPSWGLVVEAPRPRALLRRQPYEKSHWLGRVLAHWARVEFEEAEPD